MNHPTIQATPGTPIPLGHSLHPNGHQFALFAAHADKITLGLFEPNAKTPYYTVPLHRTGDIWHTALSPLPKGTRYGYQQGQDPSWLLDPYALNLSEKPLLASIDPLPSFNWEGTSHPNIAKQDLILYEMHVRGFTAHPSSNTLYPGTYRGLIDKIPHLKELGVNAVELMPIFEFNEQDSHGIDPVTKLPLPNYWGYDPIAFFAPKQSYSTGPALTEFRTLVKELHKQGIEVILDVVYNHTGKSSLRKIDPTTYYLEHDYTGCGNTVNANHPIVQELILASLKFWVKECHVDGFRLDLATALTRGPDGTPLDPPPLIHAIGQDPLLASRKWIAEAWDATGLYQLGSFPKWGPWSEWNGKYRDATRRFLKGTCGKAGVFANVFCGSEVVYRNASPLASVNFITAHDGFCLRDLVTYQLKHNWPNGEMNRDGSNSNDSWNCGAEGMTQDPTILELRERQMRNFWLALLLSQGIPMILMGDEYGHTRHGNNNPYVQDNEINWFLWYELEENQAMFQFVKELIAFRKKHPELRRTEFFPSDGLDWHGALPHQPDWSWSSRFIAFSTKEKTPLYIAFNAHYQPASIELPDGIEWKMIVNTQRGWDEQWFRGNGPKIQKMEMAPHTVVVASG